MSKIYSKKFLLITICLLLPAMVFSQVKNSVCVVKQVFYDKTKEELTDFAEEMRKNGDTNYADSLKKYLNGGSFGSGFVYIAPNHRNYIITNRHVVEHAKEVNVEFLNQNGSTTEYKGLKIVAISPDVDLAILEFPNMMQPFSTCMEFSDVTLNDGDIVYTAGFPGFEGEPAWQFGMGSITNATAKIKSLINDFVPTVIQHSAQVDSGNSGGPLLRKKKDGSYVIVGINTWKALGRQDTNFSIPSSVIKKFIDETLNPAEEKDPNVEIAKRASLFHKAIINKEAKYEDVTSFISMDFVAEHGFDMLTDVFKRATKEQKEIIGNTFLYVSPIEGMKYAIALYMYNEFQKNIVRDSISDGTDGFDIPTQIPDSDKWQVIYKFQPPRQKVTISTVWINKYGVWQIYTFDNGTISSGKSNNKQPVKRVSRNSFIDENATKAGNITFFNPCSLNIACEGFREFEKSSMDSNLPVIALQLKLNNFISLNTKCGFRMDEVIINYGDERGNNVTVISPMAGVDITAPFVLTNSLIVMPYVSLDVGADLNLLNEFTPSLFGEAEIGTKLILYKNRLVNFAFEGGATCHAPFLTFSENETSFSFTPDFRYFLGIGMGISF